MSNQVVNDYRSVLADLRNRRAQIDHAIQAIEQIVGETGPDVAPAASRTPEPPSASTIYHDMTIGDACVHFMRTKGKPQGTGALAKGIRDGGIASLSKTLYTTVYNTMTKRAERDNSDVARVGSDWGLSEWGRL